MILRSLRIFDLDDGEKSCCFSVLIVDHSVGVLCGRGKEKVLYPFL